MNGKTKSRFFDNTPAGRASLTHWLIERGAAQVTLPPCLNPY